MNKPTSLPLPSRIAFALLWVFVFTLPMTQATEIPHIGMISTVAGFVAMAAGVVAVVARKQVRYLDAVHGTMAAFIAWSAITLAWSVAPELTVQRIMTYLQLFVLVLLVWELCEEEKAVLQILSAFVLGSMIPALSTLLAFLPGQQTLVERAAVPGFDANSLAFVLALSLPVSYYLIFREKGLFSALYRMQMGFAVCAILLTGSAVTMIAGVVGLSLVCWTLHVIPMRTRGNAFALMLLLAGAAFLLGPGSMWRHVVEESKDGSVSVTAVINNGVQNMHSTPFGGFGAGSTPPASLSTSHASFTMFSETGVVGVVCFVAMLGVLILSAERMKGITKSFWFTVLGVWTVGACSLNWECLPTAWLLFGLLAAHSASLKREGVVEAAREKENFYVQGRAQVVS